MSIVYLRCKRHNREQRLRFQLLQIVLDSAGRRVQRILTEANGEVVKGAWEYTPKPLESGIYCQHCLNEGKRTPQDIDPEDLRDLGLADEPIVFQAASRFRAQAAVDALREAFHDRLAAIRALPSREAIYADQGFVDQLHPGVSQPLKQRVLPRDGRLYAFQAEAVTTALKGHDIIVTTPTASGKTLTYTIPVFETLLRNPQATALYLSPLVALTEDQLESLSRFDVTNTDWGAKGERFSIHRVCRTFDTGAGRITVARYDGSVSTGDRQAIRERKPQYILTTPDMLHMSILGGAFKERQWSYLLRGLRYVVIDELHTYRGIMGAAFANLLRRLQRLCQLHGSNPLFLCASATMVDPAGTVERFIGRRPVVIDGTSADGAPQHFRCFVLWNGASSGQAMSTQAKDVLLHLLKQRVRTIAFCRSISEINDIYRFVRAELRDSGMSQPMLKPFMRELLPEEKRAIIQELKQGQIHAVISTTALSMGIDIGSLSAAVIVGFPGSIAQLWQQAGRAGRAGEGLIILIADTNPLDQFFANHPDVLFDLSAEPIYCNPDNPYIVRDHLLRAAVEAPLTTHDIAAFGPSALAIAEKLCSEGLLVADELSRLVPTEQGEKAATQPFRNISFSVPVMTENREVLVQVDAARAQRVLHLYAHYQLIDRYYRVTHCEIDMVKGQGHILVQELERPEYITMARVEREVAVIQPWTVKHNIAFTATYGHVRCQTDVTGYYKVPLFARTGPFVFQPLGKAAPPTLRYETQAFWLTFGNHLLSTYPLEERQAGLYSLAGALRLATAVEALCDVSDVEAFGVEHHPDTGVPTVIVYDTVPGGVGISETAFAALDRVLNRAEQILVECPYCSKHPESRGCPHCVTAQYGDEQTINRHVAIAICRALRTVAV
ncbi:DEAD/DEAH box helicase [Kallotenue papyrolyticum]|uniref:DEAD/DEAH box helicase n=1 Tax=Kallotenue papyrolyticum TaxID=1325125 RepID=UPI00047270E8|nr:DEAD/DEAH box helicase [Kallotenue papyrolyticum]